MFPDAFVLTEKMQFSNIEFNRIGVKKTNLECDRLNVLKTFKRLQSILTFLKPLVHKSPINNRNPSKITVPFAPSSTN
jgi:hypothetical protein